MEKKTKLSGPQKKVLSVLDATKSTIRYTHGMLSVAYAFYDSDEARKLAGKSDVLLVTFRSLRDAGLIEVVRTASDKGKVWYYGVSYKGKLALNQ